MAFDNFGMRSDFIYVGLLGLWVGAIVGSMAQVIPYQVDILLTMALAVVIWIPAQATFNEYLLTAGVGAAGVLGALTSYIPWGVGFCSFILFAILLWRSFGIGYGRIRSVSQLILIPLFVLLFTAVFYNLSYVDFCQAGVIGGSNYCTNIAGWSSGYATNYAGCISTCTFTTFSLFGSSAFANFFATGNFVSLFTAFLTAPTGIVSILSFILGAVLLLLATGIGVSFGGSILATGGSGGIQENPQGTKMAQSLGVGLIVYGAISAAFGFWFSIFGALSIFFSVLFPVAVFYGYYQQGNQT